MTPDLRYLFNSALEVMTGREENDLDLQALTSFGDGDSRSAEVQAYAFLLCEVAEADHRFEPREQKFIESTLGSLFDLSQDEVRPFIESARASLAAFRKAAPFIQIIKQESSAADKAQLIAALEKVVTIDGQADAFEQSLVEKLREAIL